LLQYKSEKVEMVSSIRATRIADRIHKELSEILIFEASDPRLINVSITKIRVDRELAFANVYVSSYEGSDNKEEIIAGLEHAKGYLRSELARRIQLRTFPRFRFYWDPSPEHTDRIEQLIESLHKDEEPPDETEIAADERKPD
jgi:ribosome-binding factor A